MIKNLVVFTLSFLMAFFSITSIIITDFTVSVAQAQAQELERTISTNSGLQYIDLRSGSGLTPQLGEKVTVHYIGYLEDGTAFDSSRDRQTPFSFTLGIGQVIKGWDEGVSTMRVGGLRRLIVPPQLAYGQFGSGGVVPPNATLTFEVELLGVN